MRRGTRASVARALNHHVPGRWRANGNGYIIVVPGYGDLELRSLREADAFVVGAAFGERASRAHQTAVEHLADAADQRQINKVHEA